MFEKEVGFLCLQRSFKSKRKFKGDFSLIDNGCDYCITRFTNMNDYHHVLTLGPWLIGDNYLTIHRWVPNFVPDEAPICFLTAWIHILNFSIKDFDLEFLETIDSKVGRVIGIGQTTANVDRGRFSRLKCGSWKPLLSKPRLRGWVWRIQYESIKFICFKCGKLGHREDSCSIYPTEENRGSADHDKGPQIDPTKATLMHRPECTEEFGPWMLVKKLIHKKNPKTNSIGTKEKNTPFHNPPTLGTSRTRPSNTMWQERERTRNKEQNLLQVKVPYLVDLNMLFWRPYLRILHTIIIKAWPWWKM